MDRFCSCEACGAAMPVPASWPEGAVYCASCSKVRDRDPELFDFVLRVARSRAEVAVEAHYDRAHRTEED